MHRKFLFRDEMLDKSFEEAMAFNEDCERAFYKLGQRMGEWKPTRQCAYDAMHWICEISEDIDRKIKVLWWAVGIEATAIVGLLIKVLAG